MRQLTALCLPWLFILLQGCLKDRVTRTYISYEPVYRPKTEVLAEVRGGAPRALQQTGKLVLYGQYLLVNELNKGVHVIDNSNPAAPVNLAFIQIPGNVDLAVKNDILFADIHTDLLAIDIRNPREAVLRTVIPDVFPERQYAAGFNPDTSRYIVDWILHEARLESAINADRMQVENGDWLSGNALPQLNAAFGGQATAAAGLTGISGSMARFTIIGDYLYTVGQYELSSFRITDAARPVKAAVTQVGWNIETIYPLNDKLFIGGQNGMFIYSVQQPASPQSLGQFSHACFNDPVVANDRLAFVTLRAMNTGTDAGFAPPCWGTAPQTNQLDVIDIGNLMNPTLLHIYEMEEPMGMSLDGNLLFLCDGSGGLKLYDITQPEQLQLLQHISGIRPFDVIAWQGIAVVVSREGIHQYQYRSGDPLQLLSVIPVNP